MAHAVEISIPTTSVATNPSPHTIYQITIRLPLRSFTVQKRFSDFLALHQSLTAQAGSAPPASLPGKSWFTRTVTSPALTEERRKSLEKYLQTINESSDDRWRTTAAWRTFLSLPASSTSSNKSSATSLGLQGTLTSPAGAGAPITDPVVWIDCHRNLKTQLHDARLHLQRRDQAQTAHEQHESSAAAKRCLVLAGGLIVALDRGLKNLGDGHQRRSSDRLGEGELRRRRDLVANARKEKEALETLAHSLSTKRAEPGIVGGTANGSAAATTQQKSVLFGVEGVNGSQQSLVGHGGGAGRSRRVLGAPLPETEQTRELDNRGVLQLQKQTMAEQDQSLEQMTKGVMRLKELGIAINEELEVQNSMMGLLSEDVTRVGDKLQVAKKRVDRIS